MRRRCAVDRSRSLRPCSRESAHSRPGPMGRPALGVGRSCRRGDYCGMARLSRVDRARPTITISFPTADGIEADRTTIRYKNVELGRVTEIGLTPDGSRVVVTAAMQHEAESRLRADTEFWVVQPRITPSGITGLTTIVSGAYIGMLPGQGAEG